MTTMIFASRKDVHIMKKLLLLFGLSIVLVSSCEKPESRHFLEQSGYEYINSLAVSGDILWVVSSKPTNTLSFLSIIPPYQVSKINLKDGTVLINNEVPAISSMTLDRNGQPFLATYDKKIIRLNPDLSYEEYLTIPKARSIQEMIFDQTNNLWIATWDGGLFFYDGSDTLRFTISNSLLTSNSITIMSIDSESNIWFMQGLELFRVDKNKVMLKDPYTLPNNNPAGVFTMSSDKNDNLFIAKWDGNNHILYKKVLNNQWTAIDSPESSNQRSIKFIKSDKNGTIWIAYSNYPKNVLAYLDNDNWIEIQIPLDEANITDFVIYDGKLILGTPKGIFTMSL